jgi:hypothetical protein
MLVEIVQIGAAHVPQLDAFEIRPDTLIRVEIGRVAWQLLQAQPLGSTLSQEVFDRLTAMDRRSIPDDQHLARYLSQQMPQEEHDVWTVEGVVLNLQQQAATRRDTADDRHMVAPQRAAQRWRVTAWGKAAD